VTSVAFLHYAVEVAGAFLRVKLDDFLWVDGDCGESIMHIVASR